MGESCSVDIEPPTQTQLLNASMDAQGVVLAGVPGGKTQGRENLSHLSSS